MEKVVFTNGCFDILHPGHIDLLARARSLGTKLIVGLNSDESVRKIKGEPRPFMSETDRAVILQGLRSVDEVLIFAEATPQKIIEAVKPAILVKGGDWSINEIIGADFVIKNGGQVVSLPLLEGFSSSKIVERIQQTKVGSDNDSEINGSTLRSEPIKIIENSLNQHLQVFQDIFRADLKQLELGADLIYATLQNGKKLLVCGQGGSAAVAAHLVAVFGGGSETQRRAFPVIDLTTDTSALTLPVNDVGFEHILARHIAALADTGDLLIAISTSGTSPNIIRGVMKAREKGCQIICLTGSRGKKLTSLSDAGILVPSQEPARIQEAHLAIGHIWREIIDARFSENRAFL
jgi:D-glycero-beta-D-manno-heptose 1-phosphate adenylyltransferase